MSEVVAIAEVTSKQCIDNVDPLLLQASESLNISCDIGNVALSIGLSGQAHPDAQLLVSPRVSYHPEPEQASNDLGPRLNLKVAEDVALSFSARLPGFAGTLGVRKWSVDQLSPRKGGSFAAATSLYPYSDFSLGFDDPDIPEEIGTAERDADRTALATFTGAVRTMLTMREQPPRPMFEIYVKPGDNLDRVPSLYVVNHGNRPLPVSLAEAS